MDDKFIIIGSQGFIGHHLVKAFQPKLYTSHRNAPYQLNLKNPNLRLLPIKNQSHVIIAAGCANINDCEMHPQETHAINVTGTLNLVKQSIEMGLYPILFSTDYVFDGKSGDYTEFSPTCPINAYGRQKEELEKRIDEISNGNHLILRLSKIYSTTNGDASLIDEMMQAFMQKKVVRAATDQIFCPLHIEDLIIILKRLIKNNISGLMNVAGKEKVNRYQIASMVGETLNASTNLIIPISLDAIEGSPRPKNTSLCCEKLYQSVTMEPQTLKFAIQQLAATYETPPQA